jgi:2-oxoglutarate dehydrogenase complex dehydrogenase (E1) component-like enzyme
MIEAPIIHVNGDDVDAVISACKLAVEYRQRFRRDICIDLVCFRRHGHTNKEDPKITQPLTYQLIDAHPSVYQIYSEQLIREEVLTQEEIDTESQALLKSYSKEYEASKEYVPDPLEWLGSNWLGAAISNPTEKPYNQTGVRMESLQSVSSSLFPTPPFFLSAPHLSFSQVAEALYTVPETITPHPDVKKIFDSRKKQIETGKISMPFAELLAIGTLLTKFSPDQLIGVRDVSSNLMIPHPTVHVRLSGQDCVRGTFNQRHAGIFCQKTGHRYDPLSHISVPEKAATFSVCNSSLSEAAVLGFEYGYSLENESALTIWEAQFGDFANVAQSIIDNFIVSGETKWNVHSALVMLLPHGYDGQGPEHSSARMERYLQLIDDTESDIPGNDFFSRQEIETAFDNLVANDPIKNSHGEPVVSMKTLMDALLTASPGEKSERHTLSVREILEELEDEDEEEDVLEEQKDGEMINKDLWYLTFSPSLLFISLGSFLADSNFAFTSPVSLSPLLPSRRVKMMSSWLQLNSERKYNFSVVAPSTPAQYFHCLRRQIHRFPSLFSTPHFSSSADPMPSLWRS